MLEQVRKTIEEFHMAEAGDKIIVGVSGGADSICLLTVLRELSEVMSLRLHVVHINHMLRKEAQEEEEYVKEICRQQQIPCTVFHQDMRTYAKELGCSVEEAGRIYRYECFETVCQREKGQRIAVAHHQNDRVETLLFHMIRGSGMRGMGSIPAVRGKIIRPLLYISRQEIESYLSRQQIRYYMDASNTSEEYTRNLVRHKVIPVLERVNDQAVAHMGEISDLAEAYWNYVEEQAKTLEQTWVRVEGNTLVLPLEAAKGQPKLLMQHLIYRMLVHVSGSAKDLEQQHVEQVWKLLNKSVGKQITLPYGMCAVRKYEEICIQKEVEIAQKELRGMEPVPISLSGITRLEHIGEVECRIQKMDADLEISKKLYTKMLDYDRINGTLCIRNPMPGDYFIVNEQGERKKLSRFFIDNKVPKEKRQSILVLADGSRIHWIIGMRISEDLKITQSTKQVLHIEFRYKGEENG